jgi:hypothetical protein
MIIKSECNENMSLRYWIEINDFETVANIGDVS